MSNIIYIMGKSATGKDTIYNILKEKLNVNTYILYTTRPKREGEENGREYYFITNDQFEFLKGQGKVLEYRSYNVVNKEGRNDIWTYATIDDNQWKAEGDFLTVGTLESYNKMRQYAKEHPERNLSFLPVYIRIDEEVRENRALRREIMEKQPNIKEIKRRFKADNIDFSDEKLRNAGITRIQTFENYDLDNCVNSIIKYIENEKEQEVRKETQMEER